MYFLLLAGGPCRVLTGGQECTRAHTRRARLTHGAHTHTRLPQKSAGASPPSPTLGPPLRPLLQLSASPPAPPPAAPWRPRPPPRPARRHAGPPPAAWPGPACPPAAGDARARRPARTWPGPELGGPRPAEARGRREPRAGRALRRGRAAAGLWTDRAGGQPSRRAARHGAGGKDPGGVPGCADATSAAVCSLKLPCCRRLV